MSMIDEDFRTLMISIVPNGTVVEKSQVSMEQISTRVYFNRSASTQDLHLNANQGLTETTFDIEVAALNDDATAQNMAATIKSSLNGYRSAFGNSSVALGIFVEDHNDDYQSLLLNCDDGYFVAAMQAKVIHL